MLTVVKFSRTMPVKKCFGLRSPATHLRKFVKNVNGNIRQAKENEAQRVKRFNENQE